MDAAELLEDARGAPKRYRAALQDPESARDVSKRIGHVVGELMERGELECVLRICRIAKQEKRDKSLVSAHEKIIAAAWNAMETDAEVASCLLWEVMRDTNMYWAEVTTCVHAVFVSSSDHQGTLIKSRLQAHDTASYSTVCALIKGMFHRDTAQPFPLERNLHTSLIQTLRLALQKPPSSTALLYLCPMISSTAAALGYHWTCTLLEDLVDVLRQTRSDEAQSTIMTTLGSLLHRTSPTSHLLSTVLPALTSLALARTRLPSAYSCLDGLVHCYGALLPPSAAQDMVHVALQADATTGSTLLTSLLVFKNRSLDPALRGLIARHIQGHASSSTQALLAVSARPILPPLVAEEPPSDVLRKRPMEEEELPVPKVSRTASDTADSVNTEDAVEVAPFHAESPALGAAGPSDMSLRSSESIMSASVSMPSVVGIQGAAMAPPQPKRRTEAAPEVPLNLAMELDTTAGPDSEEPLWRF